MAQIFISYSRADREFLKRFVSLIRDRYGNDSLWYADNIHGDGARREMIFRKIADCELFIYLISNDSLSSQYCQVELREALRLDKQILPVIVRPKTQYPGDDMPDDLARFLSSRQYLDIVMAKGFIDSSAISSLYAAIDSLIDPASDEDSEPQMIATAAIIGLTGSAVIVALMGLVGNLSIVSPIPPRIPTATAEVTEESIESTNVARGTDIAVQATSLAIDTPPSVITPDIPQVEGIGNADVYPFYDSRVNYPDTMLVELQLILDEVYITPTPAGDVTAIPFNAEVVRPDVRSEPQSQVTPRPARAEEPVENIPDYMIAELDCIAIVFDGCEEKPVRQIELQGINEWTWRVQPIAEEGSNQSMALLLYRAEEDGSKQSNTPIYTHEFTVTVDDPFSLRDLIEENFGEVLAGLFAILVAVIGGLFAYLRPRKSSLPKVDLSGVRVFISYRRSLSWSIARKIKDDLESLEAEVFLDVDDIHGGKFNDYIISNIERCDYFVVILAPETLESEWVVKEVKHAYKFNRTIIPILTDGFELYGGEVPDEISYIQNNNAITIFPEQYPAAIEKLVRFVKPDSE